jgi:peptide deformylase
VRKKVLPIVQLGDPVLRHRGKDLTPAEIRSTEIQQLIERMRETMRKAPGVGLAAPQVGLGLRLAVIEDQESYVEEMDPDERAAKERDPVPFHVVINPRLEMTDATRVHFFEGCLSLAGFVAVVGRARAVRVHCLDHAGEPRTIEAAGWHARILQHEIDHLDGTVYVDRMETRTFMSSDDFAQHWGGEPVELVRAALDAKRLE